MKFFLLIIMWLVIANIYLFSSHKKHFLSEIENQIGEE